jgi:hypothetical protein
MSNDTINLDFAGCLSDGRGEHGCFFNYLTLFVLYIIDMAYSNGFFQTKQERDQLATQVLDAIRGKNLARVRQLIMERQMAYNPINNRIVKYNGNGSDPSNVQLGNVTFLYKRDYSRNSRDKDIILPFESIAILFLNETKLNDPYVRCCFNRRDVFDDLCKVLCQILDNSKTDPLPLIPLKKYSEVKIHNNTFKEIRKETQSVYQQFLSPVHYHDKYTLPESIPRDSLVASLLEYSYRKNRHLSNKLIPISFALSIFFLIGSGFGLFMRFTNFIVFNTINIVAPCITVICFAAFIICAVISIKKSNCCRCSEICSRKKQNSYQSIHEPEHIRTSEQSKQ